MPRYVEDAGELAKETEKECTEGEGKQDSVGIPSFEWAKYFMKQKLIN